MRRLGVLLACAFQLAVVRSQSICHYGTLTGRLLPPSGQWWQEPVLPQCKLSTEPISRLERFMTSYYSGQDGTRRTVLDRLEANVDAVKRGDDDLSPLIFHFSGPTGVGKSWLATLISFALFTGETPSALPSSFSGGGSDSTGGGGGGGGAGGYAGGGAGGSGSSGSSSSSSSSSTPCGMMDITFARDGVDDLKGKDLAEFYQKRVAQPIAAQLSACGRSVVLLEDVQHLPVALLDMLASTAFNSDDPYLSCSDPALPFCRGKRISTRKAVFVFTSDLDSEEEVSDREVTADMDSGQALAALERMWDKRCSGGGGGGGEGEEGNKKQKDEKKKKKKKGSAGKGCFFLDYDFVPITPFTVLSKSQLQQIVPLQLSNLRSAMRRTFTACGDNSGSGGGAGAVDIDSGAGGDGQEGGGWWKGNLTWTTEDVDNIIASQMSKIRLYGARRLNKYYKDKIVLKVKAAMVDFLASGGGGDFAGAKGSSCPMQLQSQFEREESAPTFLSQYGAQVVQLMKKVKDKLKASAKRTLEKAKRAWRGDAADAPGSSGKPGVVMVTDFVLSVGRQGQVTVTRQERKVEPPLEDIEDQHDEL